MTSLMAASCKDRVFVFCTKDFARRQAMPFSRLPYGRRRVRQAGDVVVCLFLDVMNFVFMAIFSHQKALMVRKFIAISACW